MVYDDFVRLVAGRARMSIEQAAAVTDAALETLADRISGGEAEDLADLLPDRLADRVRKPASRELPDPFGREEFVARVSTRAGLDAAPASAGIRAVFTTLRESVTGDEFEDVVGQLPREFAELVEPVGAQVGGQRRRYR